MAWQTVEPTPGVYNFSAYEDLFGAVRSRSMGLIAILGCTNPLYDQGQPVASAAGQQAYAAFAAAMAKHFDGQPGARILFELVNEPNLGPYK